MTLTSVILVQCVGNGEVFVIALEEIKMVIVSLSMMALINVQTSARLFTTCIQSENLCFISVSYLLS